MAYFLLQVKKTGKKGQVTIEFLFIFMIALIYIFSVVQPSITIAEAALRDVTATSQARLAAESLANAANQLMVSEGEAKKTISILVPEKTTIKCSPATPAIEFQVALSNSLETVGKCPNRICNSSISVASPNIVCPQEYVGKNFFTLEITKDSSGTINVATK